MAKNFSTLLRSYLRGVLDPLGRALVRAGVTANAVTIVGAVGVCIGSIGFLARGEILAALIVVTLFAFTDMLDGAIARAQGGSGSRFGMFLDSTTDRLSDGVIVGSLAYWFAVSEQRVAFVGALVCLVAGQLVSYAKARAEGVGVRCDVGIAERSERLVLLGLGALGYVIGVPYAFEVALWLVAVLSVITVGQRVAHVRRAIAQADRPTSRGMA